MFDVGFWEFGLIAVITLIVVGPERIPSLAKTCGRYVGKLKKFVANVKADVENEFGNFDDLGGEELKQQLQLQDEENNIIEIVKTSADDIKDSLNNEQQH